jgi:hypothetical protein
MTTELKAVIFDFGGVFTDSPFHAFSAYGKKIGASEEQVTEIVARALNIPCILVDGDGAKTVADLDAVLCLN